MKAERLLHRRIVLNDTAFVELVLWRLPEPVPPCQHSFKYRLAFVAQGKCRIRYDNERGKGDHRHIDTAEAPYSFSTPDQLIRDFDQDVRRWRYEHRND